MNTAGMVRMRFKKNLNNPLYPTYLFHLKIYLQALAVPCCNAYKIESLRTKISNHHFLDQSIFRIFIQVCNISPHKAFRLEVNINIFPYFK